MPERIQLSRKKGWRKPEGAVVVARPTKWGNPYVIGSELMDVGYGTPAAPPVRITRPLAVELFRARLQQTIDDDLVLIGGKPTTRLLGRIVANLDELRGRDLACWCPLDQACHADVLLEIANGEASE